MANLFSDFMPSKPTHPRDEIDVVFDEVMLELFGPDPDGDEIVPQKLAKLFPGSLKTPRSGRKLRWPLRTTRLILLNWWTRHRAVRAENATVARLWFKPLAASLAVIEELASVGWHPLNRLVPTLRTGDRRGFDHGT